MAAAVRPAVRRSAIASVATVSAVMLPRHAHAVTAPHAAAFPEIAAHALVRQTAPPAAWAAA